MNMTSTSPPDASGQPDDSGRPYEPAHGAPHIPIEVPGSAWGKLGPFGFRRRWWVHGAWVTALVFTLANAVLLTVRIRVENAALGTLPGRLADA